MKRYYLQNRYQDSGWQDFSGDRFEFDFVGEAVEWAESYARSAIIYGMVRVVDRVAGRVVETIPAGGRLERRERPRAPRPFPDPEAVILSRAEYDRMTVRIAELEARLADGSPLADALREADGPGMAGYKPEPLGDFD